MWHIPAHHYSWPYYQLGVFSPFARRTNARSCSRVKCRGAITNRRKNDNDADGTFQYRIDLSPPRTVIRYRSNVSLHLASDYYLVNIDSQLAPALMRQRIASSSHIPKTLSTVIATQPRNFMQTLSCSPFNLMIIHRFITKHDPITNLDSFFLAIYEIHQQLRINLRLTAASEKKTRELTR